MLPASSTTKAVEHAQSSGLQEQLECSLFNFPKGAILSNTRTENDETIGTGNEVSRNECPNATGWSSIPSLVFANNTGDFFSFHDTNNLLEADGTFVDFDVNEFLED